MTWNYVEITGLLLFLIGFYGLIARRNIIKTILSLGIMDISVILFFLGILFEAGMRPPIGESAAPAADPVPQALMITAIVIGAAVTEMCIRDRQMFFDLVSRNSRRSRKENGLFFASLLISVIAFYIILSLSQQDVIKFLMKMESDAVKKLVGMIPLFYGMTLIILFFLVYFASKYQLERRRHEFGMYLMLGMRRSRLFLLLLAEDVRSSVFVLAIGLPSAVLLSELISLVTARLAGLGIIGHRLNISLTAILWLSLIHI